MINFTGTSPESAQSQDVGEPSLHTNLVDQDYSEPWLMMVTRNPGAIQPGLPLFEMKRFVEEQIEVYRQFVIYCVELRDSDFGSKTQKTMVELRKNAVITEFWREAKVRFSEARYPVSVYQWQHLLVSGFYT